MTEIKFQEEAGCRQFEVKLQEKTFHKAISKTKASSEHSDSDSFQPQYHQIKKLGLSINKKKLTIGSWTSSENATYLSFMLQNREDFENQKSRRKSKVFYRLSKILKKRTPDQCRSHHQKLQIKFQNNLDSIIEEVQRRVQKGRPEIDTTNAYEKQSKKQIVNNNKTGVPQDEMVQKEGENSHFADNWYNLVVHQNRICIQVAWWGIQSWPA